MRRISGLAALAVAAATAAALPLTTASSAQAPTTAPSPPASSWRCALAALRRHPGAARATDGQAFVVRPRIVDADGTTHVRIDAHPTTACRSSAATWSSTATRPDAWRRRQPDPRRRR